MQLKVRTDSLKLLPKVKTRKDSGQKSLHMDTEQSLKSSSSQRSQQKPSEQKKPKSSIDMNKQDLPSFQGQRDTAQIDSLLKEGIKCINKSRIEEGFNYLHQYLEVQSLQKGRQSMSFKNDFTNLIQQVCQSAMTYVHDPSSSELCIQILQQASVLTQYEDIPIQRCHIMNNLGCAYRRIGRLSLAYNTMGQALELVQDHKDIPSKAITYLNLTAIVSQMGLHDQALKCAQNGLYVAQQELEDYLRTQNQEKDKQLEKARYVGIAFHNVAAELESLDNLDEAISNFKQAFEIIKPYLGVQDPLFKKFYDSYQRAKQKMHANLNHSSDSMKSMISVGSKSKTNPRKVSNSQIKQALQGFQSSDGYQSETATIKKAQLRPSSMQNNFVSDQYNPNLAQTQNQQEFKKIQKTPIKQWTDFESEDKDVIHQEANNLDNQSDPKMFQTQIYTSKQDEQNMSYQIQGNGLRKNSIQSKKHDNSAEINQKSDYEKKSIQIQNHDNFVDIKNPQKTLLNNNEIAQPQKHDVNNNQKPFLGNETVLSLKHESLVDINNDRKSFALKMNNFEQEDHEMLLLEHEIMREVQNDLHIAKSGYKIQSQLPMRQKSMSSTQKSQLKKQSSQVVLSDDMKIMKLQMFMKQKSAEFRQRRITKLQVTEIKLRKYPKKLDHAASFIQNQGKCFIQTNRHKNKSLINQKLFKTIRQSQLVPINITIKGEPYEQEKNSCQKYFRFKFQIDLPHHTHIKFELRSIEKTNQVVCKFDIEQNDFIRNLGLIGVYIENLELSTLEENSQLKTLKSLYTLSRHFVSVEKIALQTIVKLNVNSPKEFELYLKKISPYIQELVRIQDTNQLIILGINDFDYGLMLEQQNESQQYQVIIPFHASIMIDNKEIQTLIRIQAHIRGYLARRRVSSLKITKRKIIQRIGLITSNKENFRAHIVSNNNKNGYNIYCVNTVLKIKSNELLLSSFISQKMGSLKQETFFDFFTLDLATNVLGYSDEAQYWHQKREDDKKSLKMKITPALIHTNICRLQKAFRSHKFQQSAKINLEHSLRQKSGKNPIRKESILKKAMIYGESGNKRAYLICFNLFTESLDGVQGISPMLMNRKIQKYEQQSIQITAKSLEHLYSSEKIVPFIQKLYKLIDITEVLTIASSMIEMSLVVRTKQGLQKVDVKSFEEVKNINIHKQIVKNGGQSIVMLQDETLLPRIQLNLIIFRKIFFEINQGSMQYTNTTEFRKEMILLEPEEEIIHVDKINYTYLRKIQNKVKSFHLVVSEKTKNKHVKIEESVGNYVKNFMPTTEYGQGAQGQIDRRVTLIIPRQSISTQNQINSQILGSSESDIQAQLFFGNSNRISLNLNQISYPYESIKVPSEELLDQPKIIMNLKRQKDLPSFIILKAVIKLQRKFRTRISNEFLKLKQKIMKEQQDKQDKIGQFIKRAFRNIQGLRYIVNVYEKQNIKESSLIFTYELIEYIKPLKARGNIKNKLRGSYSWDPSKMLNFGETPLYDYIMNLIYIEEIVRIKFEKSEQMIVEKSEKIKLVKFKDANYQTLNQQEQQAETLIQQISIYDTPIIYEEIPEMLVHQTQTNNQTGRKLLFNVVYSGSKALKDKHRSQQQSEENDLDKDNTLKIEVNLNNVRKLYPTLRNKKGDLMKIIGENLTEGIIVDKQGQIFINNTKISSQFLSVVENNFVRDEQINLIFYSREVKNVNHKEIELKQDRLAKPKKKEILVKRTTMYAGSKYLVIIYYLEKKITKILKASKDEVFEDHELIYQVCATNLTKKREQDIIWEMSPESAQILSHQQHKLEIAYALSSRIQVLNQRFIYLTQSQEDALSLNMTDQKVILFLESKMKPIQNHFRNKTIQANHKIYRAFLQIYRRSNFTFDERVGSFSIQTFKSPRVKFIVFCYEDIDLAIHVKAWELDKLFSFETQIPRQKYQVMMIEAKNECMRSFLHFIEVQENIEMQNIKKQDIKMQLIFNHPKMEHFYEVFEKEKINTKTRLSKEKENTKTRLSKEKEKKQIQNLNSQKIQTGHDQAISLTQMVSNTSNFTHTLSQMVSNKSSKSQILSQQIYERSLKQQELQENI